MNNIPKYSYDIYVEENTNSKRPDKKIRPFLFKSKLTIKLTILHPYIFILQNLFRELYLS